MNLQDIINSGFKFRLYGEKDSVMAFLIENNISVENQFEDIDHAIAWLSQQAKLKMIQPGTTTKVGCCDSYDSLAT